MDIIHFFVDTWAETLRIAVNAFVQSFVLIQGGPN